MTTLDLRTSQDLRNPVLAIRAPAEDGQYRWHYLEDVAQARITL